MNIVRLSGQWHSPNQQKSKKIAIKMFRAALWLIRLINLVIEWKSTWFERSKQSWGTLQASPFMTQRWIDDFFWDKKLGKDFYFFWQILIFYCHKSDFQLSSEQQQLIVQCHHAKLQIDCRTMRFYEAEQFIDKQMAINCIINEQRAGWTYN